MIKLFMYIEQIAWLKWSLLILLLVGTIGIALYLNHLGKSFEVNSIPGIIPFELAGTVSKANEILEQWGAEGQSIAKKNIKFDFLFLIIYSITFAYMSYLAASVFRDHSRLAYSIGLVLMYGQVLAGMLDAVENLALLTMLSRGIAIAPLPFIAAVCAALKFLLIISGLVFVWIGVLAWFGLVWF